MKLILIYKCKQCPYWELYPGNTGYCEFLEKEITENMTILDTCPLEDAVGRVIEWREQTQ